MRFTDNNDGTVTDNETGLMWQKVAGDECMTWQQAQDYCYSLDLAGHTNWRCPTIKELLSIIDYGRFNPAHDPVLEGAASTYWSASTYAFDPGYAWDVYTGNGYAGIGNKTDGFFVRAVRSGS